MSKALKIYQIVDEIIEIIPNSTYNWAEFKMKEEKEKKITQCSKFK